VAGQVDQGGRAFGQDQAEALRVRPLIPVGYQQYQLLVGRAAHDAARPQHHLTVHAGNLVTRRSPECNPTGSWIRQVWRVDEFFAVNDVLATTQALTHRVLCTGQRRRNAVRRGHSPQRGWRDEFNLGTRACVEECAGLARGDGITFPDLQWIAEV